MDYVLELCGVSKTFGAVRAVDDLSLQVRRGEFLSLLGPSGCGKTTTLRIVAGFEKPSAGEVYLQGQPLGQHPSIQAPREYRLPALRAVPAYDRLPKYRLWPSDEAPLQG